MLFNKKCQIQILLYEILVWPGKVDLQGMLTEIGLEDTLELLGILRALQRSCGPRKMVVGSYFGQYPGLSGIKDPGLLKSFVLVVWWSRLGSPQLY